MKNLLQLLGLISAQVLIGVVASIAVGFFWIWIVLLILSKIFGLVFLAVFVLPAFLVSLVAGMVFLFIAALAYYVI